MSPATLWRYRMTTLLVVTDMDKTVAFYKNVLGLEVVLDFGANKTLTGGLALQTLETYRAFIGTDDISFGGNDFELYFDCSFLYPIYRKDRSCAVSSAARAVTCFIICHCAGRTQPES